MDNVTINDWLESLAAKVPTPGGGAVAALAAAVAAAQLGMVAAYTTGPKWQDREERMQELSAELADLRAAALGLVSADAKAFSAVGAAYQLPKETEAEKTARKVAIQQSLALAADPSAKTAQLATHLVKIAEEIAASGNPSVISDVAVSASVARAALESAIVNIEINEHALEDLGTKQDLKQAVVDATEAIQDADVVIETVRDQIGAA